MGKHFLKLPKMGESVAEATLTKWLKQVGESIEADDIVVEIATDKVDSDVPSEVNGVLIEKKFDENEVVPTASFTNDLGADSLDTVELIMEFEREFDIQIPDDQAEKIETVGQAVQYIESA